jgi:hypothetical protein
MLSRESYERFVENVMERLDSISNIESKIRRVHEQIEAEKEVKAVTAPFLRFHNYDYIIFDCCHSWQLIPLANFTTPKLMKNFIIILDCHSGDAGEKR